jgi:DNA-binding LytR/AlgR family response regulator
MLRVAVVEDNREYSDKLKHFFAEYEKEIKEEIEVVCYADGLDFTESYTADFDIVFMDIEMPLMNGLKAAKKLRERDKDVVLIFLTVMSQYAIYGYDVEASAFLVKPVDETLLRLRLNKILKNRKNKQEKSYIFFQDSAHVKVMVRDLLYVESMNHYCLFHTQNETYRKLISIREVEKDLKDSGFIRCNNSYLVNITCISSWRRDNVILNNGENFSVSRTKRKSFLDELAKRFGEDT